MTDEPGRDRSEDNEAREAMGSEGTDEHEDPGTADFDDGLATPDEHTADVRPSFSTAFRGYNTDEVDRYLVELFDRDAVRAEDVGRLQAELEAERARHQTERAQLETVRASLEARVVALEHELERLRGELDATRGALPEIESLRSRLETLTATYEQRVTALDALVPYLTAEARVADPEQTTPAKPDASFAAAMRADDGPDDADEEIRHPMAQDPEASIEADTGPEPSEATDAPAEVWRGDWERAPEGDASSGGREDLDDAIGWEPGGRSDEEDEHPSGEDSGPSTTR